MSAERLRVIEILREARPRLVARIEAEVGPDIEADVAYGAVSADERRSVIETAVTLAIDALVDGRDPSSEELELIAAVGEQRARQGVPHDSVIRTARAGALGALEEMEDLARQEQISATVTMELVRSLWRWTDEVVAALVEAQRRVEMEEVGRTYEQRSAFLHAALLGKLDPVQMHNGARAIGLSPDDPVRAARIRPPAGDVDSVLAGLPRSAMHGCVTAVLGSDVVALVIGEPPEIAVPGGLGPMVPLPQTARSFDAASLAVNAAAAFGLTGWHTLESVATRAAVLDNEEVGDVLVAKMLGALHDEGPFGRDLIDSLRVWWDHDQAISDAAAALCIHPNTLRHRLARIEELTGGSLSDIEHQVALWWALARLRTRADESAADGS